MFIYCSHVRLNVHYQITKKAVYRSANAVFGKVGLIVSEDVILQLIKSTCRPMSILLYGVDACALTKSVYV